MAARGRTAHSEVTLHASDSSGERMDRRQQPLTQISRRGHADGGWQCGARRMLARKGFGPKMGEGSDNAFLAGETINDNCVTDKKRVNAWFDEICHA